MLLKVEGGDYIILLVEKEVHIVKRTNTLVEAQSALKVMKQDYAGIFFIVKMISNSETESNRLACLTKRQREILHCVIKGFSNKIIAFNLGISQRTVEQHRYVIMKKLNAKNFADLVQIGMCLL
jgi:FixJ family two-component response regulator